ncbi:MAG: endonuclease/exonuclease/phosphatase family protein [Candidatus Latescibacterota bacterium]
MVNIQHEQERADGKRVKVLTVNIHKGFSQFNKRFILHRLRDAIRETEADIVFLQEVTGENTTKAALYEDWPDFPHYEFLADEVWQEFSYGKNAVYPHGHHGNAILSKYPIVHSQKFNISTNRFEQRGFLHTIVTVPGMKPPLHCVCVHLGLSSRARRKQITMLRKHINGAIPDSHPLILAGDFNDWRARIRDRTLRSLGLSDVYVATEGEFARTFPSFLPLLPLDRIYVRGAEALEASILSRGIWSRLSDHAALSAELLLHRGEEDYAPVS